MTSPVATHHQSFEGWEEELRSRLGELVDVVERPRAQPLLREVGSVSRVDGGIVTVSGLPGVQSEELVRFPHDRLGMAYDLNPGEVGVILLDEMEDIEAGAEVRRTGEVMSVPVGEAVLGRVIDPTGRPLDGRGPVRTTERLPIERPAPGIMERAPVEVPLQTGIKAVDALIPIGRGQRELIVGDRQTGKTAIAVDTILNQAGHDVICIYCTIGMRSSAVAKLVDDLRRHGALEYTSVVVTTSDDPAGRQFTAPYGATSMAEFFRDRSQDVLIIYDDLTRHARAYRELSLLLRRPPGREAYPGDIFYIHSRLLERPARLSEGRGGGSVTAMPIVETEAENISAYIPTNLISITDGQLYLSPRLFRQGVLPAIDIGRSVSRVGGKAQLSAYRSVAGDLRLSYSQFEELERFSRYGARLERGKAEALERGRRVREVLKQSRYRPLDVGEQIAQLAAVTGGVFDGLPVERVTDAASMVGRRVSDEMSALFDRLRSGATLADEDLDRIRTEARNAVSAHLSGEGS